MPERCKIDELMHREVAWHSGECENRASLSISHGCAPRYPGGRGSEHSHTGKAPGEREFLLLRVTLGVI